MYHRKSFVGGNPDDTGKPQLVPSQSALRTQHRPWYWDARHGILSNKKIFKVSIKAQIMFNVVVMIALMVTAIWLARSLP